MPAHRLVSMKQLELLVEFVEKHPVLVGRVDKVDKDNSTRLWEELATILNSVSDGAPKSIRKWREYWNEQKYTSRKKLVQRERGRKIQSCTQLSSLEERIIALTEQGAKHGNSYLEIEVDPSPVQSHNSSLTLSSSSDVPSSAAAETASLSSTTASLRPQSFSELFESQSEDAAPVVSSDPPVVSTGPNVALTPIKPRARLPIIRSVRLTPVQIVARGARANTNTSVPVAPESARSFTRPALTVVPAVHPANPTARLANSSAHPTTTSVHRKASHTTASRSRLLLRRRYRHPESSRTSAQKRVSERARQINNARISLLERQTVAMENMYRAQLEATQAQLESTRVQKESHQLMVAISTDIANTRRVVSRIERELSRRQDNLIFISNP